MFIVAWILNSMALMFTAWLIPGIHVNDFYAAFGAVVIIGLFNLFLRPVLLILTLPLTFISLGLFAFVVNAAVFWMASGWIHGFFISSFGAAFFGALVYSISSSFLTTSITK